ncbi:MAG: hypothetical protein LBL92_03495 [Propionibacteriaceae bacterium]|nr:hypothetical protein [Propionibacteriaceae bacterium]
MKEWGLTAGAASRKVGLRGDRLSQSRPGRTVEPYRELERDRSNRSDLSERSERSERSDRSERGRSVFGLSARASARALLAWAALAFSTCNFCWALGDSTSGRKTLVR